MPQNRVSKPSPGRTVILIGFVVLFVLHHDFWFWDDRRLVFGFLPIGLAYHALFSVAAASLWFTALKLAWPDELEAWADEGGAQGGGHA